MFISQKLNQAADSLEQVNWKQVTKDIIKTWDLFFNGLVILMVLIYLAGKTLGNLVHRTNDFLATNWVRMLGLSPIPVMKEEENEEADEVPLPTVPSTPTELEQAPTPVITEEVSPLTTPAVEVELKLPPPLFIEDPWEGTIEVELILPLVLETMAIPFTMPLLLTAAQAPVALLVAGQEVVQQPPPVATNRRHSRRRAHADRNRQTAQKK